MKKVEKATAVSTLVCLILGYGFILVVLEGNILAAIGAMSVILLLCYRTQR